MVTAQITMETGLGLKHKNAAGIVFQPLGTADFGQIVRDTEELLRSSAEDTGTTVETHEDEFGYRWVILRDPDFDDLVQAVNVVSTELSGGGYGDRLLAAVFAFKDDGAGRLLHLQLQARQVLPVRARARGPGAQQRARVPAQGTAREASCRSAASREVRPALR